eukprot:scaffold26918_cov63-Phaeocystis_antarctica.AAC.2
MITGEDRGRGRELDARSKSGIAPSCSGAGSVDFGVFWRKNSGTSGVAHATPTATEASLLAPPLTASVAYAPLLRLKYGTDPRTTPGGRPTAAGAAQPARAAPAPPGPAVRPRGATADPAPAAADPARRPRPPRRPADTASPLARPSRPPPPRRRAPPPPRAPARPCSWRRRRARRPPVATRRPAARPPLPPHAALKAAAACRAAPPARGDN